MSDDKDFKDPFNATYFIAFLAVFVGIGCLNAILGWITKPNLKLLALLRLLFISALSFFFFLHSYNFQTTLVLITANSHFNVS
ncbi:hypothetical protein P4S68_21205 [Pseudoalteromonas sp. Hal099]